MKALSTKKSTTTRNEDDWLEVGPIDGEMYKAFEYTKNELALFYAAMSSGSIGVSINGATDFLKAVLEPSAYNLVIRGVKNNAIEVEDLIELAQEIISEFSENPTGSPSESSASAKPTGKPSTGSAPQRGSTRASSRRRATST